MAVAAAVRLSLLADTHLRMDGTGLQVVFPRVKGQPVKGLPRPGTVDADGYLPAREPRLLVLDPLVRLHRGDENSSAEISELLGFLRTQQREHKVAIMLVHHVRKSAARQPGQSLRGSGDLHAWGDSNLYLLRSGGKLVPHAEHRSHPAPPPFAVELTGDPPRVVVQGVVETDRGDLADRILATLAKEPLSRSQLRERMAVRNETLGVELARIEADGQVIRVDGRLAVPVPSLRDRPERNDPPA